MSSLRNFGQKQQTCSLMVILVASALMFSVIITLSDTPLIHALGDSQSIQTSCNDNQPCLTVVCSEIQPCRALQSPDTDSDAAKNNVPRPLEDTEATEPAGVLEPFSNNNDYRDDRQDHLEEMQDMIEDLIRVD